MLKLPEKVVFDCPIYAQALINPNGPAAACFTFAQQGQLILFVSDYILQEIRELPSKLKPKLGVTSDRVEAMILDLAKYARHISDIPALYDHPIDPDDSHYINLAIATDSRLIVTRDMHLLSLMENSDNAKVFQSRFPSLRIMEPNTLASEVRESLA